MSFLLTILFLICSTPSISEGADCKKDEQTSRLSSTKTYSRAQQKSLPAQETVADIFDMELAGRFVIKPNKRVMVKANKVIRKEHNVSPDEIFEVGLADGLVVKPVVVDTPSEADSPPSLSNDSKTEANAFSAVSCGKSVKKISRKDRKTYFADIRATVQKKESYPKITKKMELEKKVIFSFLIYHDSHDKNSTIKKSSGIELFVKNSAPAYNEYLFPSRIRQLKYI